jgi:hypothetical protein
VVLRQKTLSLSFAAVLILSAIFVSLPQYLDQEVHADGIFRHEIDANIGGRDVRLLVQVNPPILTSETIDEAFVQFRLFDASSNATIPHTTYLISVTKGITDEDARPIMQDFFHSHNGLLTIRIQPQEGDITIFGTREDFQQAWVADPGGTINVRGPLLLEGGLYHFNILIFGIDFDTNIFPQGEEPEFDSWLSIGDIFEESVEYNGQSYNTTIISYYDQVEDFSFDAEAKTFSWSMPFDWNTTRIRSTEIFVHEEVQIPKSLAGIGDAPFFAATVNGAPISGRMLAVDPYTSEQDLTLHYLLSKNDIINLAGQVPEDTPEMTFTLAPATSASAQTTGEMATDTGGVNVGVGWTPGQLNADTESTLTLTFSDAYSGETITDDVNYNLRIFDLNDMQVYMQSDLVAEGGTGTQTIDFPSNENYRMEVEITGIMEDGQPVDQTRNGIARGIVVVPEFPIGIMLAVAGVLGTVIAVQRLARKMPGF